MQKWEYWTENLKDYNNFGNFQTQLRKIGQEGWELVAVDNGVAYFKRPARVEPYFPTFNVNLPDKAKDESP